MAPSPPCLSMLIWGDCIPWDETRNLTDVGVLGVCLQWRRAAEMMREKMQRPTGRIIGDSWWWEWIIVVGLSWLVWFSKQVVVVHEQLVLNLANRSHKKKERSNALVVFFLAVSWRDSWPKNESLSLITHPMSFQTHKTFVHPRNTN